MKISTSFINNEKYNIKSNQRFQSFPPIKSLSKDTVSFSSLNKTMEDITADDEVFSCFINRVIENPKISKIKATELLKNSGSIKNFLDQYLRPNGYKDKYSQFIIKAVEEAKRPEDIIKISPNWGYWVFENKFGSDFFIGSVPSDIGEKVDFETLTQSLLKGEKTNYNTKELNGGLSGKRAFLVDTGEHKYVLKTQQDYTLYSNKLSKAIEEDNWLKDTFIKRYKENDQMKSDSSYMNAMIDFYLNLNKCPNALKIHCFDAKTGSALYDFVEGEKYSGKLDIRTVNSLMPSLSEIGVIYNDISPDNLRIQDGVIKIIDSGESNFSDILKPTVSGYQIEMPNWSGNSILSLIGAIGLLDNNK